jgi:hypothetical protein
MRRISLLLLVVLAGCGSDDDAGTLGSGSESKTKKAGERSLTGCLKLWEGPHVGSTRLGYVAKTQTIYAKVEVAKGRCRVAFASKDGKVYGRYIEKSNITGAWTKEKESASVATALKVVNSANATGQADGGLKPGAP